MYANPELVRVCIKIYKEKFLHYSSSCNKLPAEYVIENTVKEILSMALDYIEEVPSGSIEITEVA